MTKQVRGMGLFLGWCHKLLCMHVYKDLILCKSVYDIKPGIDPCPLLVRLCDRWWLDFVTFTIMIVNRGDWLWSPANIKGANKDGYIYVGRSATVHNLLFCTHTLCMSYVTNMFLMVRSQYRVNNYCDLCTVKAKKVNKNIQQKTLLSFTTIPLY